MGTGSRAGRSNDYQLILIDGTSQSVLASGTILMDGSNSLTNPLSFSVGGQSIAPGDVVKLLISEDPSSSAGFFTAADLTISTNSAPVPEPTLLVML